MMKILGIVYKLSPVIIQNIFVTFYNLKANYYRYSGIYNNKKLYFKRWQYQSYEKIKKEQKNRLTSFLKYARENSILYRNQIPKKKEYSVEDLMQLEVMTKDDLILEFDQRRTINKGHISYTGGTTGASLKVIYTSQGLQERRAFLDYFWEQSGYNRGDRIAWFSGKHIVTNDNSNIFWRKDILNNIRYYSTFHINHNNIRYYIDNLNKFRPKFMVGFPSSVAQIAKIAKELGISYNHSVNCFFPTAETLLENDVMEITKFFNCDIKNQYASSEGAPFITECKAGNLHYEMLTGVIEVVDENLNPTEEGEILVTSFTTYGTPLIRYKIGDRIKFGSKKIKCPCGQETPIIQNILGRPTDYILSKDGVKINLGNISNCTKGVKGIIQFQIVQNSRNLVNVLVVPGKDFSSKEKSVFHKNLKKTLGNSMEIIIHEVDLIPQEKSGKYKIIVRNI